MFSDHGEGPLKCSCCPETFTEFEAYQKHKLNRLCPRYKTVYKMRIQNGERVDTQSDVPDFETLLHDSTIPEPHIPPDTLHPTSLRPVAQYGDRNEESQFIWSQTRDLETGAPVGADNLQVITWKGVDGQVMHACFN